MGNKTKWDSLSMREKADLIGIYIKNGISSLEEIKKHYNKFKEGGPKDTWKPQYWLTPRYEANSLREAITQAYDDGRKGSNIIYKNKAYKALLNNEDELQYNKEKQWEENKSITPEQVVDAYINNVVWVMENPKNTGYNPKDKKYYSYADSSLPYNIGPGIAYTSEMGQKLDYNKGYTKEELNEVLKEGLLPLAIEAAEQMKTKYGEAADTMSLGNRLIQLDIAHNVRPKGSKKANMPITGWPSLSNAMIEGNDLLLKKNTYSGSTRRQKMRNQLAWQNYIDEDFLQNK